MILVDSSVWIDYFHGASTPQADILHRLFAHETLAIGDLILTSLTIVEIGGRDIAIQAAMNFRTLRGLGVTVRKTIDTLIATRCLKNGLKLLHDDRDFDPFVKHLGLQVVG